MRENSTYFTQPDKKGKYLSVSLLSNHHYIFYCCFWTLGNGKTVCFYFQLGRKIDKVLLINDLHLFSMKHLWRPG